MSVNHDLVRAPRSEGKEIQPTKPSIPGLVIPVKRRASATLAGALASYYALAETQPMLPTVLAIAASSLLYVDVADLIPSLHPRSEPVETARQALLIGLGAAVICAVHAALEP